MNRFRARFSNKHTVLPVIHVENQAQALDNAEIAVEAGADGVWLVNHEIPYQTMLEIYSELRKQLPSLWVGLNCLDSGPAWIAEAPSVAGAWLDSAYILEDRAEQPMASLFQHTMRVEIPWDGIYFGGVAFKGQRKVRPENYGEAARRAMPFMDVVTTSGPGTGYAADVGKIKAMKDAIGDFPLAIASGITPENVHQYMPHADCFLVASGISIDFSNLSLPKTRKLIERVREGVSPLATPA